MYYSASALTFNTQSQVNAWGAANPNPTQIFDNVTITTTSSTDPIVDLSPLNSITYISLDLYINTNYALTSINAFNNLTGVRRLEIKFNNNVGFTSIGGFNALTSVSQTISIQYNYNCQAVNGFNALTSINNDLYVSSSGNVTGFTNLTSVGFLSIAKVDWNTGQPITDISGLSNLTSITTNSSGEDLSIGYTSLTNLNSLSNLTTCQYISLARNYFLNDISGLANISTPLLNFTSIDNVALSNCAIDPVCDLIAASGTTIIFGNALGCQNTSQVETVCLAILPLKFSEINVITKQNTNIINWNTVQEVNCHYQVIERSVDAREWEEIGQVPSTNTPFKVQYEFVDTKPLSSAYYRIKNVDFDGKEQFSDIRFVRNTNLSEVNDLQILLLGDMLTLNLPNSFKSKPINFQIIDMMGRNIINENLFCNNEKVIDFQLNEFIANYGIYIARVTCDGRSHELKFVK